MGVEHVGHCAARALQCLGIAVELVVAVRSDGHGFDGERDVFGVGGLGELSVLGRGFRLPLEHAQPAVHDVLHCFVDRAGPASNSTDAVVRKQPPGNGGWPR